jgi:hypothetical protein
MADKTEYPPILPPGFHTMTPDELKRAVVEGFPLSKRREALWNSLTFVLNALTDLKIPCDVWLDGSFLTKKIDPDDVDFIVDIPIESWNSATPEQEAFIDNLSDQLYRKSDNLHSFVMFKTPAGHAMHADMTRVHLQWEKDFGFAYISKQPKGIALIEVQS